MPFVGQQTLKKILKLNDKREALSSELSAEVLRFKAETGMDLRASEETPPAELSAEEKSVEFMRDVAYALHGKRRPREPRAPRREPVVVVDDALEDSVVEALDAGATPSVAESAEDAPSNDQGGEDAGSEIG